MVFAFQGFIIVFFITWHTIQCKCTVSDYTVERNTAIFGTFQTLQNGQKLDI